MVNHRLATTFLVIVGLSCILASSLPVRHEQAGWQQLSLAVPLTQNHQVILALKQRNLDVLEKIFWDISNPESSRFGQYLSQDELTAIVGNPDGVRVVVQWLLDEGVSMHQIDVMANQDAVYVNAPLHTIEQLFSVEMKMFMSPHGINYRSTTPHKLPEHIAQHIDLIHGVHDFPPRVKSSRKPTEEVVMPTEVNVDSQVSIVSAGSRGGQPSISIMFTLCQNAGQCTFPRSFEVNATAIGNNGMGSKSVSSYFSCQNKTCFFTISVEFYINYQISLRLYYADGSHSNTATWPFPVISTPIVLPQTLSQQYNIPPSSRGTNPRTTQAVVEFEQQYYSQQDLVEFLEEVGVGEPAPVTLIGPNDGPAGGEANLDIQWLMGLAPGIPTTFWSVKANSTEEVDHILEWLYAMGNLTNPPMVNSVSYGMAAGNVDKYLGHGYLARSDVEMQKLSTRGITIIIASGDTGAGDLGGPPMGVNTCQPLHPDWPSQSPYVLSVGSTYLTPLAEPICYDDPQLDCLKNPIGEVGVSLDNGLFWTTGGGFANTQTTPSYQADFVTSYLNASTVKFPPHGVWNPTGRAYPDMSTCGHNLLVRLQGQFIPVDGTSASAPIAAAMLSLINDALLNAGKSPLGFVNPLLYKIAREHPEAFYDVTVGNNRCGALGADPVCCPYGYQAAQGFDTVGGLGSPNFSILRSLILSMK